MSAYSCPLAVQSYQGEADAKPYKQPGQPNPIGWFAAERRRLL